MPRLEKPGCGQHQTTRPEQSRVPGAGLSVEGQSVGPGEVSGSSVDTQGAFSANGNLCSDREGAQSDLDFRSRSV